MTFASEKDFQAAVVALCAWLGLAVFHPYESRRSQPGYPDLTVVGPGGVLWRELKTTTGRVSPAQRDWLARLTDAGMDARVWRPDDWPNMIRAELDTIRAPRKDHL